MASVNKIILIGNCGKDPETRHTASGMQVCSVSIATSGKRKDKNTGEYVEDTQWHRVIFYDKLAEFAGKYLQKGKQVYISGSMKYGKYTDNNGNERYTADVVATEIQLLGSREEGQAAPRQAAPQQRPAQRQAAQQAQDDFDDDIPFN